MSHLFFFAFLHKWWLSFWTEGWDKAALLSLGTIPLPLPPTLSLWNNALSVACCAYYSAFGTDLQLGQGGALSGLSDILSKVSWMGWRNGWPGPTSGSDVRLWCSLGLHLMVCSVALSIKSPVPAKAISSSKFCTRLSMMFLSFICRIEMIGDEEAKSRDTSTWQGLRLVQVILAQSLETCLILSCSLVTPYPFSLLFCYLVTYPSSCHLWALPSLPHPFYDYDHLLTINGDRDVFSALGENFAADPLGLGIEMQEMRKTDFKV